MSSINKYDSFRIIVNMPAHGGEVLTIPTG